MSDDGDLGADHGAAAAAVESPKAYLSTIVTRLCVDQLRSARMQREQYVGPWLPEPLVALESEGPAETSELSDSLSMAFLMLLERLSPLERAVFLLHEVFDYQYAEVARIVGKSEANCRQIVRRAREHLAAQRPRFQVAPEQQEQFANQFVRTCASGDLDGVLTLLTDDVAVYSDGGGKVTAARRPIHGRDRVARFLLGLFEKAPPDVEIRSVTVNGQPGLVTYVAGRPYNVVALEVDDGRLRGLYFVLNPDKLTKVPPPGSGSVRLQAP